MVAGNENGIPVIKPSEVPVALQHCFAADRPAFLWGAPGVGKSRLVDECGEIVIKIKKNNGDDTYRVLDIRTCQQDPVDVRGIPSVSDGVTIWNIPDFLPTEGSGIIFLDEFVQAAQAVQNPWSQLILDGRLGNYIKPKGFQIIAAGNRQKDRAASHALPMHLANRFIHFELQVDLDDWVKWALSHNIRTDVISFLRFRPALLHDFDPTSRKMAYPTPRTWEFVSQIMDTKPPKGLEFAMVSGTVGEGAAAEYMGFLKIFRKIEHPDKIIMYPEKAAVHDDDPATMYATCGSLAKKASEQTIGNIVKYANRLPDEFGVLLVKDCIKNCEDVINTRHFIEWSSAHSDVFV